MDAAVGLYVNWIKAQNVPGLTLEVLREKGRTPVLFMIVPGSNNTSETVLMYGHMDKQPPMTEYWSDVETPPPRARVQNH
jgi:acetylornithine deacetylase/succinyl-diaminopimelate desuccinylase-like protein